MSVYGVAVLGAGGVGKSALCSRLVSHRYDGFYKPTETNASYFLRFQNDKQDSMVMLQDTVAVEKVSSDQLLKPPFWYEQFEEEKIMGDEDDDNAPLLKKRGSAMSGNPMTAQHKRFGVFVVFDLANAESFEAASTLLDDVFARANGFAPQGWKRAPIAVIVVGNKCDTVGKKRQVKQDDVDALLQRWTHSAIVERTTKLPRVHIRYMEASAKLGTNCENLLPELFSMIRKLPSKRDVLTPDLGDGWYGKALKNYETVRILHAYGQDVAVVYNRYSRRAKRTLGPAFKMNWLKAAMDPITKNTIDKIPEIPVPPRFKVFPRWMLCCFCLRQPAPEKDENESSEESEGEEVAEESDEE